MFKEWYGPWAQSLSGLAAARETIWENEIHQARGADQRIVEIKGILSSDTQPSSSPADKNNSKHPCCRTMHIQTSISHAAYPPNLELRTSGTLDTKLQQPRITTPSAPCSKQNPLFKCCQSPCRRKNTQPDQSPSHTKIKSCDRGPAYQSHTTTWTN